MDAGAVQRSHSMLLSALPWVDATWRSASQSAGNVPLVSMQPPPQDSPPPGWYPQASGQRYWDGMQWTQHMAPSAGPSGSNTWAVVSHLPVGGFIIPLLALLIEGPKDEYVKYHSTEALNFHITTLIVAFGGMFIGFALTVLTKGVGALIFIPLWLCLVFGPIVLGIMGMIAASKGDYYRYPVTLRFIKGPAALAT